MTFESATRLLNQKALLKQSPSREREFKSSLPLREGARGRGKITSFQEDAVGLRSVRLEAVEGLALRSALLF